MAVERCFVVLFASSALRFVRRTKLGCNPLRDAQVAKATRAINDALGTLRKKPDMRASTISRFHAKVPATFLVWFLASRKSGGQALRASAGRPRCRPSNSPSLRESKLESSLPPSHRDLRIKRLTHGLGGNHFSNRSL